ncbi:hypothetical protein K6U66_02540 [Vibrio alginolyticus]|uniref:hypothetical protein n=1 Tax=Vibrio alginolyticus TaxID=663 RepID=UPI001EEA3A71|nr:hypothetical protein [Vibrio alginolyticus]MCG6316673.1 hypothetical protein [Vibrio alginolyticus]
MKKFPRDEQQVQLDINALKDREITDKNKFDISYRHTLNVVGQFTLTKNTDKFYVECNEHGTKYNVSYQGLFSTHPSRRTVGCNLCFLNEITKNEEIGTKAYLERVLGIRLPWIIVKDMISHCEGFEFKVASEEQFEQFTIIGQKKHIKLICKKNEEHEESQSWGNIAHTIRQYAGLVKVENHHHLRCNACQPRQAINKLSKEQAQERLNQEKRVWEILDDYTSWSEPCTGQCAECKHEGREILLTKRPRDFIGINCPFCDEFSPQVLKHDIGYYKQWLSYVSNGKLTTNISEPPNDSLKMFEVNCECGNSFETSEYRLSRHKYYLCEDCNKKDIQKEIMENRQIELETICKNHHFDYQGQSHQEIVDLLNTKYHPPVIELDFISILIENHIHPDDENYFIDAIRFLANHITKKEIARVLNVTEWKINYHIKKHNIDCSKASGQRYPRYLHNKVKEKTIDACYWAGLLAADGWISVSSKYKCSLNLTLNAIDAHIVNGLLHFLNISQPVRYEVKSASNYNKELGIKYSIVANAKINGLCYVEQFRDYFNITRQKTSSYSPPNNLTKRQFFAFFAGFLEGDGSVILVKTPVIKFVSASPDATEYFIRELRKYISDVGFNINAKKNVEKVFFSTTTSQAIYDEIILTGAPLLMDRKWSKFGP